MKIREKRKGLYEARPYISGRRVSVYGKTHKEVRDKIRSLQDKSAVQNGSGSVMLETFIEDWLKTQEVRREAGEISPQTLSQRRQSLNKWVLPQLGGTPLENLTRAAIKRHFDSLSKTALELARTRGIEVRGSRNRQAAFEALRAALNDAIEAGFITENPCKSQGRKTIKPPHKQKDIRCFTWEQVELILEESKKGPPYLYFLLLLGFYSGMREGELLGLRFEGLDFIRNKIKVRTQIARDENGSPEERNPKWGSVRDVDMPQFVMKQVAAWQGDKPSKALVFPNTQGKALRGNNFIRRVFKPLIERLGLPASDFHTLRHTHASHLIEAGVSIKTIQHRLGHRKIQVTLDTYGHLLPDSQEQAVKALESFGGTKSQNPAQEGSTKGGTVGTESREKPYGDVAQFG